MKKALLIKLLTIFITLKHFQTHHNDILHGGFVQDTSAGCNHDHDAKDEEIRLLNFSY